MHPVQRDPYLRLVNGAIDAYTESGYDGTGVKEIAAHADSCKQSFYKNFANRSACFIDAYETVVGRIADAVRAAVATDAPWLEQLRAGLDAVLALIEENPGYVRIVLIEPSGAGPWATKHHRSRLDLLPPLLDAARALSPDGADLPERTGTIALGSAVTMLIDEYRAGFSRSTAELAHDLYFALLMPYVGPGDATRMAAEAYAT